MMDLSEPLRLSLHSLLSCFVFTRAVHALIKPCGQFLYFALSPDAFRALANLPQFLTWTQLGQTWLKNFGTSL